MRSVLYRRTIAACFVLFLGVASQGVFAQNPEGDEPAKSADPGKDKPLPTPAETVSTTKHDVTVGGQVIHYTANAGNLLIRDDKDKPNASIFYAAYTQDGADPKTRPVTFFYNGGPGAATIWLHMGSFAPMRIVSPSSSRR